MLMSEEEARTQGHMSSVVEFTAPDGGITRCCGCSECREVAHMFKTANDLCHDARDAVPIISDEDGSQTMKNPRDVVDGMIASAWRAFIFQDIDSASIFLRFALKHRLARWGNDGLNMDFVKMTAEEAALCSACGATH